MALSVRMLCDAKIRNLNVHIYSNVKFDNNNRWTICGATEFYQKLCINNVCMCDVYAWIVCNPMFCIFSMQFYRNSKRNKTNNCKHIYSECSYILYACYFIRKKKSRISFVVHIICERNEIWALEWNMFAESIEKRQNWYQNGSWRGFFFLFDWKIY